jgi:hypothetical protein
MLYWYASASRSAADVLRYAGAGTQFTCFAGTEVQILTAEEQELAYCSAPDSTFVSFQ